MPDKEIACRDCNQMFVFTEGEQQFFATKGLVDPQRCKPCRDRRRVDPDDKDAKVIVCKGCKQEFRFSGGEQRFYAARKLHDPQRCKPCRDLRRLDPAKTRKQVAAPAAQEG